MEYVRSRAAPALDGLVTGYSGYRLTGPPGTHQGLPSDRLILVVPLTGTLDIVGRDGTAAFPATLGGLHDRPVVISHDGLQHGVQIDLTWRAARALLGLPAGELAGEVLDPAAVLGPRAVELAERLHTAPTWPDRFRVLDAALAALVRDRPAAPPPEVGRAWRRLAETGGNLTVADLAGELGWSRRHLTERFRRELGVPPKTAARLIRFARACRLLRRPGARPADVAVRCGYFDQAHLAREFRALGGTTATRWLAEFPSVQDRGAAPG
ncbi:helix-turn-helix domain-containing protein [Actinomadura kijaniata]|uniref:helix-turn-helix domain-containing protein n=1 Tax=Actinomadura kijaniata TaxID=46161 RepID=UPI00083565A9|nr:AraC family transcriptional regulator [Actinomadura kijaniata]